MLTITMMILATMFMVFKHPISMMMIILSQAILICLSCGMMTNTWWFSYMLFMVMIGGLLVLFMYMTNVACNEKFKTKKIKYFYAFVLMVSIMTLMFMNNHQILDFLQISNWVNFNSLEMPVMIMKYYNQPANVTLLMVVIYLLITMIMTVKITDLTSGALRQKN